IRAAAHLLEAPVEDIEAADGRVFVTGTDRSLTFQEIAKAVYSEMGRLPRDAREELEVTKVYDPYFGTTTSATHIVALEIDPETYKVELNRYVVAEDCGHIINPMIVDGQVHGAVAQGIGAALYEEVIYDAAGQLLTASLADYAIPTASVMPPIATVHLEAESPSTVGGFRGMGEGGMIGAPAAIANALADALAPLGAEIFELPMTPERLFRLIEKVKARAQGVDSLASGIESSNPLPSSGESYANLISSPSTAAFNHAGVLIPPTSAFQCPSAVSLSARTPARHVVRDLPLPNSSESVILTSKLADIQGISANDRPGLVVGCVSRRQ
ncbi:MAG: molybdopterin cofactor-binding domain-containing protein, partial [Stellaceae bacterium]